MYGSIIEERALKENISLSNDLAHQIYIRGSKEKLAVVSRSPAELLAATRKEWLRLIRQLQRERSSTINKVRAAELERLLNWMEDLKFTSHAPQDALVADVTFANADDFTKVPPVCKTVYITYEFEREKLHKLTSWMPPKALIVTYEQERSNK